MGDFKEDARNTLRKSSALSIGVSEFLGTGILVFISCLGATTSDIGLFQSSLVAGLAVMIVLHLFGHISGAYVNPVTTVCAYVMGEIDITLVPLYLVSQLAGGILGFGLLKAILPEVFTTLLINHGPGMTLPVRNVVPTIQVFAVELLITFILSLANCASWDVRTATMKDALALRFGFLVAALNFVSVPLTGCSMNPARSLGPALWYNDWTLHWVYWVAPLTAAVIGSLTYKILLCTNTQRNKW